MDNHNNLHPSDIDVDSNDEDDDEGDKDDDDDDDISSSISIARGPSIVSIRKRCFTCQSSTGVTAQCPSAYDLEQWQRARQSGKHAVQLCSAYRFR